MHRGDPRERAIGRDGIDAEIARDSVELEHLASAGRGREVDRAHVRRRADAVSVQQLELSAGCLFVAGDRVAGGVGRVEAEEEAPAAADDLHEKEGGAPNGEHGDGAPPYGSPASAADAVTVPCRSVDRRSLSAERRRTGGSE